MLKAKFGDCSVDGCGKENTVLYRRNPPMCQSCYYKDKQERSKKKSTSSKKKKSISPISDKRAKELKTYREKRDQYLKNNPICEVHDCDNKTTNCHHKAGRSGSLLYNDEYFMACCSSCHPKRIHENPKWARDNGYIITINIKQK